MLNSVTIFGRLVRDPEVRSTASGRTVVSFSIACDRGTGEQKQTSFFDVNAWEKTGELVSKYFKQGSLIGIRGRLNQRRWQTQDGQNRSAVEIIAEELQFVPASAKTEQGAAPATPATAAPAPAPAPQAYTGGQQMTAQVPYIPDAYKAPQPAMTPVEDGDELPF